jgi:hypothetical protein
MSYELYGFDTPSSFKVSLIETFCFLGERHTSGNVI